MYRTNGKRKDRRALMAAALSAVALAAGNPNVAVAASDIFVKLGDIKGESIDSKHKDEIELLSWSWGVVGSFRNSAKQPQQPQQPAASAQAACAQDITIVKTVDSASPLLFAKAASGANISSATFSVRKSDTSQDYLVFTLSDVMVTSVSQGGAEGGGTPTESVTFGFSGGTIAVMRQSATGAAAEPIVASVPASCR
ncbi:MAG TPA: type VI secretion system tube protein Hcp [Casimicrobiaceae bacterium]|nr:type VI secretion system tube protein Hcp [Casimicrobiaceae bacterium]